MHIYQNHTIINTFIHTHTHTTLVVGGLIHITQYFLTLLKVFQLEKIKIYRSYWAYPKKKLKNRAEKAKKRFVYQDLGILYWINQLHHKNMKQLRLTYQPSLM